VGTGDPAPPPQRDRASQFSVHICCGQMAGWTKMALDMEVGLGDFVRWGHRSCSPKKGQSPLPNFRPISIVAKRLDASRCHLVRRFGLSTGDFVLDRDPAPSPKTRQSSPIFGPCLLRPNGCIDQDATWYKGRPRPTPHCVR